MHKLSVRILFWQQRNLSYPPIDPETGELVDGVGWMKAVRRQRRARLAPAGEPDLADL